MESTIWHQLTYLENRLTDIEIDLRLPKASGAREGMIGSLELINAIEWTE